MAHVTAYRVRDGKKVRVPEHWLEHEVFGRQFRKTKPTTSTTSPAASGGAAQKKES